MNTWKVQTRVDSQHPWITVRKNLNEHETALELGTRMLRGEQVRPVRETEEEQRANVRELSTRLRGAR